MKTRRELQVALERAGAAMAHSLDGSDMAKAWDRAYGDIQQINHLTETVSYEELAASATASEGRIAELTEALRWTLEWIDAVPEGAQLPAMPGFDRDYVNDLLAGSAAPSAQVPTAYVRASELEKLADPRVAGVGVMLHKEAGGNLVALFMAASAATQDTLKNADGERMKSWAKFIVREGNSLPDHACAECVPHSDILKAGFQCVYHEATAAIESYRATLKESK